MQVKEGCITPHQKEYGDAPKSHTHSPMPVNHLDMILSLGPNTTYIMNFVVQEGGHEFERLT